MVAEGADHEVRRELFRAGRRGGLVRLDMLAQQTGHLPVTTAAWRRAAELWDEGVGEGRSGSTATTAIPRHRLRLCRSHPDGRRSRLR
ncbi:hypothetical protein OJF2_71840 [Aquisphaera giovannonii]|uniref:Uncharacterized protein n=1 Tax=Aquisphaera giovannonii TaxID=406548 RepID=A0A5B9WFC4_9BACT|nr:hypothetical protein OJF2_71840 [Aquisphaera giovannonii]